MPYFACVCVGSRVLGQGTLSFHMNSCITSFRGRAPHAQVMPDNNSCDIQIHRQHDPLQPQSAAPGAASVHSSQQGPFSFYPSPPNTSRHNSPPAAPSATTAAPNGSPTSLAHVGPTSSYAPSFTASQIHPKGIPNDTSAASTRFQPPSTLEQPVLALTRHVLSDAHQVCSSLLNLTMHVPVSSIALLMGHWDCMACALNQAPADTHTTFIQFDPVHLGPTVAAGDVCNTGGYHQGRSHNLSRHSGPNASPPR